jgi:hypothetical protein
MKELKDKGYFIMADGTKSSDHAAPAKKKAKSETKPGKKRESSIAAKAKSAAPAGKDQAKKGTGRPGKKAKEAAEDSANDLDIEGEESKLEASD